MTKRTALIFIFSFATAVIIMAWGFEIIGGYQPCALCLQQRHPYYVGIALAAVLLFAPLPFEPGRVQGIGFILLSLIFALSFFYAIRHAGVEWKWWTAPGGCGAVDLSQPLVPLGNLQAGLEKIPVYCDEAPLRILGLSFAGWNAVASLTLLAASLHITFKR